MSVTGVSDVNNLIPQMWSPIVYAELRKNLVIAPIFERKYEGAIRSMGDTVKVYQLTAAVGQMLTSDKDLFDAEAMNTVAYNITVNKRAVAAFEVTDQLMLESMDFQIEMQNSLAYAVKKQIEDELISALAANVSTSAPDHDISPATPGQLAAVDLSTMNVLLANQNVPPDECVLALANSYYGDLLLSTQFTSSDYIAMNATTSSGQFKMPVFGFTIARSSNLANDVGYAIHKSAIQVVMQQDITIKMSDLHSQNKFGKLVSADILWGYQVFDNKRYVKISA